MHGVVTRSRRVLHSGNVQPVEQRVVELLRTLHDAREAWVFLTLWPSAPRSPDLARLTVRGGRNPGPTRPGSRFQPFPPRRAGLDGRIWYRTSLQNGHSVLGRPHGGLHAAARIARSRPRAERVRSTDRPPGSRSSGRRRSGLGPRSSSRPTTRRPRQASRCVCNGQSGAQDSGSYPISRTSCAHRQDSAILAAQASASSREATSMIEKPPTTALVSGTGPSATDPSVDTMLAC